jgi:Putative beta barrel porin-7 (BBP7)
VLARHLNALLVALLFAFPAAASEPAAAQVPDAYGCTVSARVANSNELAGCDASCNQRCCTDFFDNPPHCWYVQADALVLSRTSGRDRPLTVANGTGETMLSMGDLDLGFQLGPRILVGRHSDPNHGWELAYFGLHEWSARAVAEEANNLDIPGKLVGVAEDYSGADRVAISYSSRLHNAEANMLDHRDSWSALAGLRYFHLNEEVLLTATDSDSGTSDYTAQSQSDLLGLQLGLRRGSLGNRWGWELSAKGGLYASLMLQQQLLLDNGNTFVLRNGSARAGSAAFLGDINFVVFRQLNDSWSLRAGYAVMYVAGVALAAEQFDFDNLSTSGQQVIRGDLFLHGASLGLESRW